MSYDIVITADAENDILKLSKSGNKSLMKKLNSLLNELREHPLTGTGQIEKLKYYQEPTYSRRINHEHRLVYRINNYTITVLVVSCFGHYIESK
jgi:toxin YoeB